VPPVLIGHDRETFVKDVLNGLQYGPGDPNRATIFVGPRGSGKTVLLSRIAELAEQQGWISVEVASVPGMLGEILEQTQVRGASFISGKAKSYWSSISIQGFGITREMNAETAPSWRLQMSKFLDELAEQDVGLLITVDEISATLDEMVVLATAFQMFVRERRNVALVMAGLPSGVSQLLQISSISFLRRAFQHRLSPLDLTEVRISMRQTIEAAGRDIAKDALERAVQATGGYPFLFQLIGYHIWRQSPNSKRITNTDVDDGIELANADMRRMIFDSTIHDLSETDLRFLEAMTIDDKESKMSDIANRMGVSANYASQYRQRLIEQGVIAKVRTGVVAFEIPMLKEYLREMNS
jgi:hypothetical protein